MNFGLIVEGHGEIAAAPILIRRIAAAVDREVGLRVLQPHRVARGKLVKEAEVQRAVELMGRKVDSGGAILVLFDADGDCPAQIAPTVQGWAVSQRADREIAVVLAKEEFESWFIAAAESLRGKRGLPEDLSAPEDAEAIKSPKAWLGDRMPHGYSETLDQPAFSALFDLDQARATTSFDKLFREVSRLLGV